MSNAATWHALAARIEAATAPDRELDALIACAQRGYTMHEDSKPAERGIFAFWVGKPRESECINCSSWPDPTASLDAAAALVPEGFMWRVQSWPDGVNEAFAERGSGDFGAVEARHTRSFAATPALALAAAACRARAAREGE